LRKKIGEVKLGGCEKRIQKLHTEGKITARERIDYLIDANEKNIEMGALACESINPKLIFNYLSNLFKRIF
jgi:3-methylcrotonyl-CoA carboxylase beta subunit